MAHEPRARVLAIGGNVMLAHDIAHREHDFLRRFVLDQAFVRRHQLVRPRGVHAGENLVASLGALSLAAFRAADTRRLAIAGIDRLAILPARGQLLTRREGGNHLVAIVVRVLHTLDEGYRPIGRKRREQALDAQLFVDELLGVGDAQVLAPAAASVDWARRIARPHASSSARAPRALRACARLCTRIRFCFFLRVFLTPFFMISHATHCVTRTP